jgi:biotin operon repressor
MLDYNTILANTARQKLNLGRPRLRLLPKPAEILDGDELLTWAKETAARRLRGFAAKTRSTTPARPVRACTWDTKRIPDAELDPRILPHLPATMKELVFNTGLSWNTIKRRLPVIAHSERIQVGARSMLLWKPISSPTPGPINPKDKALVFAAIMAQLPATVKDIAQRTDLSRNSVHQRLKQLEAEGQVMSTVNEIGHHELIWSCTNSLN